MNAHLTCGVCGIGFRGRSDAIYASTIERARRGRQQATVGGRGSRRHRGAQSGVEDWS